MSDKKPKVDLTPYKPFQKISILQLMGLIIVVSSIIIIVYELLLK